MIQKLFVNCVEMLYAKRRPIVNALIVRILIIGIFPKFGI
jgi:hypothetical protein